jgi:thimet oligopeptidase
MKPKMNVHYIALLCCVLTTFQSQCQTKSDNPFLVDINVPVDYAKVSPKHLEDYTKRTFSDVKTMLADMKQQSSVTFSNVFGTLDDIYNKISTASNNHYMLYWVSTDSIIREKGLSGYQLLDSLSTGIRSDKVLYAKMLRYRSSNDYKELKGHKKNLVDEMVLEFERSGVNLNKKDLLKFKKLTQEINDLSAAYSSNMNASREILTLDEQGAKGLPDGFKANYKVAENKYEIPIINSTNEIVMSNAAIEETRKAYYIKFYNRAADKNLAILDSLVKKRDQLAKVMGYPTFAAYSQVPKMAKDPETVWHFIDDLISRSKEKAKNDIQLLENEKKSKLQPWDIAFYKNQILQKKYQVNSEAVREFFPMDQCLNGMFAIYQKLLGLEFRKVKNPSVWHEEVEFYEVYEGDKLKGRFYMDLYPRPNKETWFYGVNLTSGKSTENGYEIPVAMLLGNFTKPSKTQPSLLTQKELKTLFHEFGHIMNMMSYHGEFSSQANSKSDFTESMSQLFENWLWDYDVLSTFAKHYKSGEVLPKATFDNMKKAKNVASGVTAMQFLIRCLYDMNLYDRYNPKAPVRTDQLWRDIDKQLGLMNFYVENTHQQASWIHINTHPFYMYGYLWSEVYAMDMFTEFEKNGLTDQQTGIRYRELILANGTQRDIVKAVEEFLGRPSDNKAYIKSLGL